MMSSLQIGALGMTVYQEMLSVVGNNLANAETTGYKESKITFSDLFSRTLRTGISADEDAGGTNPVQIGLGVGVASVDKNMSQGSFTSTGKDFDVGIDGEGFFVVNDGSGNVFTRDGSFDVDAAGFLVDPATGYRVQRIGNAGEDSGFQLPGSSSIAIPYNTRLPGTLTQTIDFLGNLSASDYEPTTTRLQASNLAYSLTSGGHAATTNEFSEVEQLQAFADDDTIDIAGRTTDGTAVSGTFTYGGANDGTTLQDLLDVITTVLGGPAKASASLGFSSICNSQAMAVCPYRQASSSPVRRTRKTRRASATRASSSRCNATTPPANASRLPLARASVIYRKAVSRSPARTIIRPAVSRTSRLAGW